MPWNGTFINVQHWFVVTLLLRWLLDSCPVCGQPGWHWWLCHLWRLDCSLYSSAAAILYKKTCEFRIAKSVICLLYFIILDAFVVLNSYKFLFVGWPGCWHKRSDSRKRSEVSCAFCAKSGCGEATITWVKFWSWAPLCSGKSSSVRVWRKTPQSQNKKAKNTLDGQHLKCKKKKKL